MRVWRVAAAVVAAAAGACGHGARQVLVSQAPVDTHTDVAVTVPITQVATTVTTAPLPPTTTTTRRAVAAPEIKRTPPPPGTVPPIPPVQPDPLQGDPDGSGGLGRTRVTVDGPLTMTVQTYPNGPQGPGSAVQQWYANVRDQLCRDVVGLKVNFGDGTGFDYVGAQNTCRDHPEGWWFSGEYHHYSTPGRYDLAVTFYLRNADGTNTTGTAHQLVVITEDVPG